MSKNHNQNTNESHRQLTQQMRAIASRSILYQQSVIKRLNISGNDFISIDLLNELGPMTAGELSKKTGLSTGTITALIDRLEKIGYARREKDPKDRRRVIIVPTYEEKDEIKTSYESLNERMLQLAANYSDDECQLINDFLGQAIDVLDHELQTDQQ
ncbi:MarR family winged helix-turn-helix transcriptional regulator [Carnobacterium maltaromaticum]|uniref:MarR family winged helix-turn-helix transcriptional regulator n=1 Tax=Carnobacterium maltaromaticum TaxID=2751 RepID=UPI001E464702|nr:MarR family transcriptional regulator [Carnobacterium maltaromaticum]